MGIPGLVLLGIADNWPLFSAPAGSVDAVVIMLAWHKPSWWIIYALMATVGEVIGGYLTYLFSEKGGEDTLEKKYGKERTAKVHEWLQKRGAGVMVTLGAILPPPFPFTPVLMAAGVLHDPKYKFLSCLTVGRTTRFLILAYLGKRYGQTVIDWSTHYYRPLLYALIALAVLGCVGGLLYYFTWYKPHHAAAQKPAEQKSASR